MRAIFMDRQKYIQETSVIFSFSPTKGKAVLSVAEVPGATMVLKCRHGTVFLRYTVPDYLIPKVVRCSQGFSWGGSNSTFPLQWLTGIPCQGSIS